MKAGDTAAWVISHVLGVRSLTLQCPLGSLSGPGDFLSTVHSQEEQKRKRKTDPKTMQSARHEAATSWF